MGKRKIDLLIGSKYKNLTVLKDLGYINGNNHYSCLCTCGEIIELRISRILHQKSTHKGCKGIMNKIHFNLKYSPQESSFRAKASNYKAIAKQRKISFDLNIDDTILLLKQNCFYCDKEPNNTYNAVERNRNPQKQYNFYKIDEYNIKYSGIDRLDNNFGYSLNNVVSCCKECNTAKLDRTQIEFREWIIRLYNNFILKN